MIQINGIIKKKNKNIDYNQKMLIGESKNKCAKS